MAGGGSKGAYEAGALYGMLRSQNDSKTTKFAYDVVTGVSIGAINTAGVSLWKPGSEWDMVDWLSDTWANMASNKVFVDWHPLGIVTGLLKKSGIFDTSAGIKTIAGIFAQFDNKIERKIAVSCVDANTGAYVVFNETTHNPVKAVISSSSIPFAFPHQIWEDINGEKVVCMDGGSVWNTNLVSAVQRCREQVDDDSEIVLDIL
jgi:predicted acylesterase/phospholipase RssA